jgi:hypothetical protein
VDAVLGDLPAAAAPGPDEASRVLALFGDVHRRGRWRLGRRVRGLGLFGGVRLGLSGFALFGAQHADAGDERPPAGAPVVHLRARTAFGSLTVRRG